MREVMDQSPRIIMVGVVIVGLFVMAAVADALGIWTGIRSLISDDSQTMQVVTIRVIDAETEASLSNVHVLLFSTGQAMGKFTDSVGIATFTLNSDGSNAQIVGERDGYEIFNGPLSLTDDQVFTLPLRQRSNTSSGGVIIRVVDEEDQAVSGARVQLLVGEDILGELTDANGIAKWTLAFPDGKIDAQLNVSMPAFEPRPLTLTLLPDRIINIRLDQRRDTLDVSTPIAPLSSAQAMPTPTEGIPTPTWVPPVITANAATSSEISDDLSQNLRLTQLHSPYRVTRNLIIKPGAALIIDPGVIVKFDTGQGLFVEGLIISRGTIEDPIHFTSVKDDSLGGDTNGDGSASEANRGDWRGIVFRDSSVDANSRIEHSHISHAGSNGEGAIHLIGASPTLVSNTLVENRAYAVSADLGSFPVVSNNSLANNGGNGLEIRPGTLVASGSWLNPDIAYAVNGVVTVGENATLSIGPGNTIKFANNSFIDVFGAIEARGTDTSQVTFTSLKDDAPLGDTNGDGNSSAPVAGDWTMIRFRDSSNDSSSLIQHAIINYAGKHSNDRFGAIHLVAASPTILNCQILNSHGYAISADTSSFPKASGNLLLQNHGNGLEIRAGDMSSSGVWENKDIVYIVTGPVTIGNSATLSLAAGTTVKFMENAHFNVRGSFRSVGNESQPVTLTSYKDDQHGGDTNGDSSSSAPSPGDWTMIRFYDESNDANSIVEFTVISYAGRYQRDNYGAIHLLSASPTIRNNRITDSYSYGIWHDSTSAPTLANNSFERIALDNVFREQ